MPTLTKPPGLNIFYWLWTEMMNEEQELAFGTWFERKGFTVQVNGKVRDARNQLITVERLRSRWEEECLEDFYFPLDTAMITEYVKGVADGLEDGRKKKSDEGPSLSEKRNRFRELFLENYESEENGATIKIVSKTNRTNLPVSDTRIVARLRGIMMDENFQPPAREDCLDMLADCKEDTMIQMREEKLDAIKFDADLKFDFKAWTEKVFAYYGIKNEKLERRMFKHMMHQIKRAAFCQFTEQDFMYLFYSKIQGIGKSRLFKHLTSPFFNGLNDSATLGMLKDDNSRRALFSDAPAVIDFKEMGLGGASNSENFAAEMKSFMDQKVFKTRQMFADYLVDTHAYSVWVSSTNLRVEEVIKDSDYRRFFSFDFGLTKEDKIKYNQENRWGEIDQFFSETLKDAYRSLDENKEPPTIQGERFIELCKAQSDYATKQDTIQTFLNDIGYELSTDPEDGFTEITDKLIYSRYKVWAKENGYKIYNIGVMQVLIAQSVNARTHANSDGKPCYYYRARVK